MSLLADCNSQAEVDQLLARCANDTRMLGYTFWPEYFDAPFSPAHIQYLSRIDDETPCVKDVICGARGIGKSTLLKMRVCRAIMYRRAHFILYISKSETMAMMQTEGIKRMLLGNKLIREMPVFGNIKTPNASTMDESFSKSSWVAHWPGDEGDNTGILVMPRGAQQQVRGLVYDKWRPDLIIIDDLEDPETINNENVRGDNFAYVISDVSRCVSPTRKNWHIYYADTLKHEDSVMARLLRADGWRKTVIPMCDENYRTLMDPFITQEQVDADVAEARANGTLDQFARECMCTAFPQEGAKFQQSYFQHYTEDEPPQQGMQRLRDDPAIETIITCDPAKTTGDKSCKCAIVAWGINRAARRFYLRDIDKGRYHPDELIRRYFNMAQRFKAICGGVEITGLEEFIKWPMQNYMIDNGIFLPIIWCKARGKKEARAGMLETIYAQGRVWHNVDVANYIEMPLLSYPRPAEWDVLDAAAYLFEVMEQGSQYFHGATASDESDLKAFKELDREQEEVLEYDYDYGGLDAMWMETSKRTSGRRLPRALRS